MAIVLVNFNRLNDPDLLTKARFVRTSLASHPLFSGEWPPYVPSLQRLDDHIDGMQKACDAAVHHDTQKIKLKNEAREELVAALKKIAKHVELVAGDDHGALQGCGFDLRSEITVKKDKSIPAPHFVVRHGELRGTMIGKLSAIPGAKSYVLEFTDGDPTVESNWKQYGIYTTVTGILITGLTPGVNYSFRMKAIGSQGESPWSMPYTLMAL